MIGRTWMIRLGLLSAVFAFAPVVAPACERDADCDTGLFCHTESSTCLPFCAARGGSGTWGDECWGTCNGTPVKGTWDCFQCNIACGEPPTCEMDVNCFAPNRCDANGKCVAPPACDMGVNCFSPDRCENDRCVSGGCPAESVYTESDRGKVENYCAACTGGKVLPPSTQLTCHTGEGGWGPFGSECTAPYCSGCSCVCPSETPVDRNGTCVQCENDSQCRGGKVCDTATFTCGCPQGAFELSNGQCGECRTDADCSDPAKPACSADNRCVSGAPPTIQITLYRDASISGPRFMIGETITVGVDARPAGNLNPPPTITVTMAGGGQQCSGTGSCTFSYTFAAAQSVTFSATATSSDGGQASASETATAYPARVEVSPASAATIPGGSLVFEAKAVDLTGQPVSPQPSVTWGASAGTIDAGGVFKAPQVSGGVTITAMLANGLSASAGASIGGTLAIAPANVNLMEGESASFTAELKDLLGAGHPPASPVQWSLEGNSCSGANLQGNVFTAPAQLPTATCSAVVRARYFDLSYSAQVSVFKLGVRLTAPGDGTGYKATGTPPTAKLVASAEATTDVESISIDGQPCTNGQLTKRTYSCTMDGLTPGKKLIHASATLNGKTVTSPELDFYVFGPPQAPTFDKPAAGIKQFVGRGIDVKGTAQDGADNVASASTPKGIALFTVSGADETQRINGSSFETSFRALTRGRYRFTATATNHAGLTGPAATSPEVIVVSTPIVTWVQPVSPFTVPGGQKVTLKVKLDDPDQLAAKLEIIQTLPQQTVLKSWTNPRGSEFTVEWSTTTPASRNPFYTFQARVTFADIVPLAPDIVGTSLPFLLEVVDPIVLVSSASASPNPVTGTTTRLSVLGRSPLYTNDGDVAVKWQMKSGPASAALSFDGMSREVDATFSKAGLYTFEATLRDPAGGQVLSSTSVVVKPSLQLEPSEAQYVKPGQLVALRVSDKDQFGQATPPASGTAWQCRTASGASCPADHVFTAGGAQATFQAGATLGGPYVIEAANGSLTGRNTVMVVSNFPPSVVVGTTDGQNRYQAPLSLRLRATAQDVDGQVVRVTFFINGKPFVVSASPFELAQTNVLPGTYEVIARAEDNNGAASDSARFTYTVDPPGLAITGVSPRGLTTSDRSDAVIQVSGTRFVRSNTYLPSSMVLWDGQPRASTVRSVDYVTTTLEVRLNPDDLLRPRTVSLQVVNPDQSRSPEYPFIVDGPPIVRCIDLGGRGSCAGSTLPPGLRGASARAAAHAGSAADPASGAPTLTRRSQVQALGDFVGGGIRWTVIQPGTGNVLHETPFTVSGPLSLEAIGTLSGGLYIVRAEGMNLAGAVSPAVEAPFFLPATSLSAVRVYPNPWRVDQHADIGVTFGSLPENSTVKLFTVAGQWVRTIDAPAGDRAEWNLLNDAGEKVQSGLYLYLVTTSGGEKTRGKIVIIR